MDLLETEEKGSARLNERLIFGSGAGRGGAGRGGGRVEEDTQAFALSCLVNGNVH